jgi:hypothetical protein
MSGARIGTTGVRRLDETSTGEIQILVVSSLASNFKGVTKIEGLCKNDYFLKKKIFGLLPTQTQY